MVLSELNMWNPALYETQIVPLVYLSGVLLFISGISIVRNHNIWVWGIVFLRIFFTFAKCVNHCTETHNKQETN